MWLYIQSWMLVSSRRPRFAFLPGLTMSAFHLLGAIQFLWKLLSCRGHPTCLIGKSLLCGAGLKSATLLCVWFGSSAFFCWIFLGCHCHPPMSFLALCLLLSGDSGFAMLLPRLLKLTFKQHHVARNRKALPALLPQLLFSCHTLPSSVSRPHLPPWLPLYIVS